MVEMDGNQELKENLEWRGVSCKPCMENWTSVIQIKNIKNIFGRAENISLGA